MVKIALTDFRVHLSDFVNNVAYKNERLRVCKNGKPVFAVISEEDMKTFEQLEDAMDVIMAERIKAEGEFVSFEELAKELNV